MKPFISIKYFLNTLLQEKYIHFSRQFVFIGCLFSFFFLIIFQPLGLGKIESTMRRLIMTGGISSIYFIILFTVFFIAEKKFYLKKGSNHLNIRNFTLINLIGLIIIGLLVNLGISEFNAKPITFYTIFKFISYTFLVHTMCFIFTILYYYVKCYELDHTRPEVEAKEIVTSSEVYELVNSLPMDVSTIIFIKAEDNYANIFFEVKGQIKNLLIRGTIKEFASKFRPEELFHCHRSFLVSPKKVKKVTGNAKGYKATLDGYDEKIPVSRNQGLKLQQLISQY